MFLINNHFVNKKGGDSDFFSPVNSQKSKDIQCEKHLRNWNQGIVCHRIIEFT